MKVKIKLKMTCSKCVIIYREYNKPFQKVCIFKEQSLEDDLKFVVRYVKEHPVIKYCEYLEIQQNNKILYKNTVKNLKLLSRRINLY